MSKMTMEFQRQIDELRKQPSTPTRAEIKDSKKTDKNALIAAVREEVFELDPKCICGKCKPSKTDQMHEIESRAKLRNRPLKEIFNVQNCVRMSRKCHSLVTGEVGKGKGMTVKCLDAKKRAMGPIEVKWKDGRRIVYQRENV